MTTTTLRYRCDQCDMRTATHAEMVEHRRVTAFHFTDRFDPEAVVARNAKRITERETAEPAELTDLQITELDNVDKALEAVRRALGDARRAVTYNTDLPTRYRMAVLAELIVMRDALDKADATPVLPAR